MKKVLAIAILLSASMAHGHAIQAGWWRAENSVKLNGIPLPGSENEECISKSKAKDLKATIAKDLKGKGCELTQWKVKNKKLAASLICKNDDIDAKGDLAGDVTDKMYDLKGEASGKWKALPATVAVHMKGNWVSACPK